MHFLPHFSLTALTTAFHGMESAESRRKGSAVRLGFGASLPCCRPSVCYLNLCPLSFEEDVGYTFLYGGCQN